MKPNIITILLLTSYTLGALTNSQDTPLSTTSFAQTQPPLDFCSEGKRQRYRDSIKDIQKYFPTGAPFGQYLSYYTHALLSPFRGCNVGCTAADKAAWRYGGLWLCYHYGGTMSSEGSFQCLEGIRALFPDCDGHTPGHEPTPTSTVYCNSSQRTAYRNSLTQCQGHATGGAMLICVEQRIIQYPGCNQECSPTDYSKFTAFARNCFTKFQAKVGAADCLKSLRISYPTCIRPPSPHHNLHPFPIQWDPSTLTPLKDARSLSRRPVHSCSDEQRVIFRKEIKLCETKYPYYYRKANFLCVRTKIRYFKKCIEVGGCQTEDEKIFTYGMKTYCSYQYRAGAKDKFSDCLYGYQQSFPDCAKTPAPEPRKKVPLDFPAPTVPYTPEATSSVYYPELDVSNVPWCAFPKKVEYFDKVVDCPQFQGRKKFVDCVLGAAYSI